jgi:hypothetical protein
MLCLGRVGIDPVAGHLPRANGPPFVSQGQRPWTPQYQRFTGLKARHPMERHRPRGAGPSARIRFLVCAKPGAMRRADEWWPFRPRPAQGQTPQHFSAPTRNSSHRGLKSAPFGTDLNGARTMPLFAISIGFGFGIGSGIEVVHDEDHEVVRGGEVVGGSSRRSGSPPVADTSSGSPLATPLAAWPPDGDWKSPLRGCAIGLEMDWRWS